MTIQSIKSGLTTVIFSTFISSMTVLSAYAGPGTLATTPLFLSTTVTPNIYLTLDNSFSMEYGPIVDDSLKNMVSRFGVRDGLPLIVNGDGFLTARKYYNPSWRVVPSPFLFGFFTTDDVIPPESAVLDPGPKLLRSHLVNYNYYNPDVTYLPWAGKEANGADMYTNAIPTAALQHPTQPNGNKVDLTKIQNFYTTQSAAPYRLYIPTYAVWSDINNDGKMVVNEFIETTIRPNTLEMQNFANWFVYYRTRELASKAAIGRLIHNNEYARIGMTVFNKPKGSGTIKNIPLKPMSDTANKQALLKSYYGSGLAGNTPTREVLKAVGDFFMQTNSSAPIFSSSLGGECQQNFNILVTDGYYDPDTQLNIGNTDINDSNNTSIFDGDATESNDGGNYADDHSNTLADIAMHYYETDLRSDLSNNVPTSNNDKANHQHLVNYTVSFGLSGTLDPNISPIHQKFKGWPLPQANKSTTIDDLWHAAYNSRGKFFNVQNSGQLSLALNEAINNSIVSRNGTSTTSIAVNSSRLTTSSLIYLSMFNPKDWTGDLLAYKIKSDPLTGVSPTGELSPTKEWAAGTLLTNRNFRSKPRTVLTYDQDHVNARDYNNRATYGQPIDIGKGIAFQWADLNDDQKDDLRMDANGSKETNDTNAKLRLAYLRGDRSQEGGLFRTRSSLLGDLVNSGPVFVGPPDLSWPDVGPYFPDKKTSAYTKTYSDFKLDQSNRKKVVYVASNDGMLHAFDAEKGDEMFAYIPAKLFTKVHQEGMHYLTQKNYAHRFYNDLTPTISDIYVDFKDGYGSTWHSVLVGGLRGGGAGIYALNITEPIRFLERDADKIALWEFTDDNDPDLGYTYSQPQIARSNDDKNSWIAVFGNGYNSKNGDGAAKLFILTIAKGVDGLWTTGDYIKISTGSGTTAKPNGLATPTLVDLDGNKTVDRIYAGDIEGQMWSFDLSGATQAEWAKETPKLLFKTPKGQPITTKPDISKHPTVADNASNAPNVMVHFGSGQYLTPGDTSSKKQNYFYGIWDKGTTVKDNELVEQTVVKQKATATSTSTLRVLSNNAVNYNDSTNPPLKNGWKIKLPTTGERSVTNPVLRNGVVYFNTFIPVSNDPCLSGGYGFRFAVKQLTGGPTDRTVIDSNNDGKLDGKDNIDGDIGSAIRQDGFLPSPVFLEDGGNRAEKGTDTRCENSFTFTGGEGNQVECFASIRTGRFSWQELLQ